LGSKSRKPSTKSDFLSKFYDGLVKSHKTNIFQTTSQKGRRQGVQILRNGVLDVRRNDEG
jgi:hypothetical protein